MIKEKSVAAKGIELSPSGVEVCKAGGLDVQTGSIDQTLPFNDNNFDYAICNCNSSLLMDSRAIL